MKWTVGSIVKRATEILREKGSKSPRLDAELLLVHSLKLKDRVELYVNFDRPLTEREVEEYRQLIIRRVKGEPVAYITGKKEFFGFEFKVKRGVLIPRPETETLVEEALKLLKGKKGQRIVDVGTGSGCIAITVCKLTKGENRVIGVDISKEALKVAKENAKRLKCQVQFVRTSLLKGLKGPFDAIISNPPYIGIGDKRVEREVVKYEPAVALFAGRTGLELIEKLIRDSYGKLRKGGFLALEFGEGQGKEVRELLVKAGFKEVKIRKDLSGKERVGIGVK
ncbi:peptide chain release factor N(5)-glutamine methyltransferase [Thermovibrio sp.]